MLTLYDEFAGWGGSSQGAAAVPGVQVAMAVNHVQIAVDVHQLNFPDADHECGDVTKLDLTRFPRFDLFWASPACPPFSNARGERQYFDHATQQALFEDPAETGDQRRQRQQLAKRRALMEEVPRYLEAMAVRGRPVLAGCVENVVQARRWDQFPTWRRQIELAGPGYRTWLIALNAMHAQPVATTWAPQSRPRLFLAFALRTLGRVPDWDKWLRPRAWCPDCDQWVNAVQVFKDPRQDMGVYGIRNGQYVYRCPRIHGTWTHRQRPNGQRPNGQRPGILEPAVLPAAAAIDWTLPPGSRIGDRVDAKGRPNPLEPATLRRIEAGLRRHTRPITPDGPLDGPLDVSEHGDERRPGVRASSGDVLTVLPMPAPAGGTWRDGVAPVDHPMPARTTRDTDALVVPPLLVPTVARDRTAYPTDGPLRTQTTRQETALVAAPFLASLRGGGAKHTTRSVDEPLLTFSAAGTHHALINAGAMVVRHFGSRGDGGEHCSTVQEPLRTLTTRGHQSLVTWAEQGLLVPYYGNGTARTTRVPVGALTTRDRYALVVPYPVPETVRVEDCTFRMLTPPEIAAGMAFRPDYRVTGTNRQKVAGYGNAVCPPCAEVILSALVEAITGHDLPR